MSETIEAWLFVAGVILAFWLLRTDAISLLVTSVQGFAIVGSFVEGLLFTSVLTTTPAIVAIVESAPYVPAWQLALIGAAGAVCGDLLVFRFVRSRLAERFLSLMFSPGMSRFGARLSKSPLWWVAPLFGALIIASPFPDEIGLIMMGLSKIKLYQLVPLAFLANAGGIFLMVIAVQHL